MCQSVGATVNGGFSLIDDDSAFVLFQGVLLCVLAVHGVLCHHALPRPGVQHASGGQRGGRRIVHFHVCRDSLSRSHVCPSPFCVELRVLFFTLRRSAWAKSLAANLFVFEWTQVLQAAVQAQVIVATLFMTNAIQRDVGLGCQRDCICTREQRLTNNLSLANVCFADKRRVGFKRVPQTCMCVQILGYILARLVPERWHEGQLVNDEEGADGLSFDTDDW